MQRLERLLTCADGSVEMETLSYVAESSAEFCKISLHVHTLNYSFPSQLEPCPVTPVFTRGRVMSARGVFMTGKKQEHPDLSQTVSLKRSMVL